MTNKKAIYETILTEHRRITNEISDIKANSYELNDEEKIKLADHILFNDESQLLIPQILALDQQFLNLVREHDH